MYGSVDRPLFILTRFATAVALKRTIQHSGEREASEILKLISVNINKFKINCLFMWLKLLPLEKNKEPSLC